MTKGRSVAGSRVTIHPSPSHGRPGWVVCSRYRHGPRERKWFCSAVAAESHAASQREKLAEGKALTPDLDPGQRESYWQARRILRPASITLELAAQELIQARAILNGQGSLADACRHYVRAMSGSGRFVADIVTDYLDAQGRRERDPDYVRNLGHVLGQFSGAFQCRLQDVQAADVQTWLDGLPVGIRTRANYAAAVWQLVHFAREEREDLAPDWRGLRGLSVPRAGPGKIQPYSPEELSKILGYAEAQAERWLPYLAIRAFTGIRYREMHRMRPDSFHLRQRKIALEGSMTKTGAPRLIEISVELGAWLKKYPPVEGKIAPYPYRSLAPRMVELIRAAGVENRHNGFRDAFASYAMARLGDAWKVSQTCGHSPAMLNRNYREIRLPDGRLITGAMARRWFGIGPGDGKAKTLRVRFG